MVNFDVLRDQLMQNEFLQGGALIAAASWLWYQCRRLPQIMSDYAVRYLTISARFSRGCEDFVPLASYTHKIHEGAKSGRFLSVVSGEKSVLVPAGRRWFRRGLCIVNTSFTQRDLEQLNNDGVAVAQDIEISLFGIGKRRELSRLLKECREHFEIESRGSLSVQTSENWGWEPVAELQPRSFDSVFSDRVDDLIRDVDQFVASENRYKRLGIPYRRGYLFYGPPGTGKTSMVKALATYLQKDLCVFSPKSQNIQRLFSCNNRIILIEDVDAALRASLSRESGDKEEREFGLSTADLLNAIDGVTSGHGNILIMTTNYRDRIDPALLRPGRIDLEIYLGHVTETQWEKLCLSYYGTRLPFPNTEFTPSEAQQAMQASGGSTDRFLEALSK